MTPRKLYNIVEDNARDFEKHLRSSQERLSTLSDQQLDLTHEILEHLHRVATLQLTHAPLHSAQVQQSLQERRLQEQRLRKQQEGTEAKISAALAERAGLDESIEALEQQIETQLAADPAWVALREQLDDALQANDEAVTGYAEIRQECLDKLPAYTANRAYRYLRDQGYGNDDYRRNRLNRYFDGWLAMKVDYRNNRNNELKLLAMQARNDALQAERDAHIQPLQAKVDRRMAESRKLVGVNQALARGEALEKQLASDRERAGRIQEELALYPLNQDPHYLRAHQLMTEQLQDRTLEELVERARQTPETEDDEVNMKLRVLYPHLKQVEADLQLARETEADAESAYGRAYDLLTSVNSRSIQDADYRYSTPQPLERMISAYMVQEIDLNAFLEVLLKNRQYIVRSSASSSGSSRRSSSSSGSRSSSGGGGFSSSGSSGGGGFRTTDSF